MQSFFEKGEITCYIPFKMALLYQYLVMRPVFFSSPRPDGKGKKNEVHLHTVRYLFPKNGI